MTAAAPKRPSPARSISRTPRCVISSGSPRRRGIRKGEQAMPRRCALIVIGLALVAAIAPAAVAAAPPFGLDDQPVVINPPARTAANGVDCGWIEMVGPGLIADPTV